MFFTVSLSKDEQKLTYHMSPVLRGILWFFLISIVLMFLFSFSVADFNNAPLPGKINTFVLPIILLIGSLYKYSLVFNKNTSEIEIYSGVVFFYKTKKFKFEELNNIVKRRIKIRSFNKGEMENKITSYRRDRFIFGFVINGKMILIDRNCKPLKTEQFYMSFKSFFPLIVSDESP